LAVLATGLLFFRAAPASAEGPHETSPFHEITVMTQNLYPGFSEEGVLSATDFPSLVAAAAEAWQAVHDTNFPARANRIAAEITAARPDLVGLQEAFLYHEYNFTDGSEETIDFLQILLDSLAAHGAHYRLAAWEADIDVFLPIAVDGDFNALAGVQVTDRGAFLVRTDLPPGFLRLLSTSTGNYDASISLPVAGGAGEILIQRGWVAADVRARGRLFRFVSTHLEDLDLDVQAAQVEELLAGPADGGGLPVILVGDFNSDAGANEPGYAAIVTGGFHDAWLDLYAPPGDTCCQAPDLLHPYALSFRYDVIFRKGGPTTESISLVGDQTGDRTSGGLWPSDHAGLVGSFQLPDD
jgi:endonuclease/exonuclease/phosphatase family metal-dependent hydrolase